MKEVVHVAGGLANKMFQCAFALALRERGYEVYIDYDVSITEFEHDKIDLCRIFPNLALEQMPAKMFKYGNDLSVKGKVMRRLSLLTGEHYYISHSHKYDGTFTDNLKTDGYVIGFFQNEKYFPQNIGFLRHQLEFAPLEGNLNVELAEKLRSQNSVAIHIRKGDGYATWPEFQGTCSVEYYKKSVEYFKERFQDLHFYIFTDSCDWVKKNLGWMEYTLVDWNPCEGWGNHVDMQLMSLCKHNIIANSTYSWWGAWLNQNLTKIVIAPSLWFNLNSRVKEQAEIVPEKWIKL